MKKIIIISIILATIFVSDIFGQQDPMYSQYMFNTMSVNPGYTGSREALNFTTLLRTQWIGIANAPKTQSFILHTPLYDSKMGVGFSVVNDMWGALNTKVINLDYSYTIKIDDYSKLAFGLKAGLNITQADLYGMEIHDRNDEVFQTNIENALSPNFGVGMYYHSDIWYLGVSVPKIMEQSLLDNSVQYKQSKNQRHFFVIGGYVWEITKDFKFKPSFMTRMTSGAPVSADISGMFLIKDAYWVGLSNRWKESIDVVLVLNVTDQLRLGYTYDFSISKLAKYTSGSHEVMLSYDFIYNKDKIKSPRYF